jgi:hypothetical protein
MAGSPLMGVFWHMGFKFEASGLTIDGTEREKKKRECR